MQVDEVLLHLVERLDHRLDVVQVAVLQRVVAEHVLAIVEAGQVRQDAAGGGVAVERAVGRVLVQRALQTALVQEGGVVRRHRSAGGRDRHRADVRGTRILDAELLADAVAVVVLAEVLVHQIGAELVRGLEAQGDARGAEVAAVDATVQVGVLAVAVVDAAQAGHAQGEHVAERDVDRAGDLEVVVVAVLHGRVAAELAGGLGGDQVHRAAGGVTAVEGALRAAQHFHPVDVEEVAVLEVVDGDRQLVLVDADALGAAGADHVGADAADLQVEAAEVGAGEVGVGDLQQQVLAAFELFVLQRVGGEGRDRDRRILEVGLTTFGGDHHFADRGRSAGGGIARGSWGAGGRECGLGGQKRTERARHHQDTAFHHVSQNRRIRRWIAKMPAALAVGRRLCLTIQRSVKARPQSRFIPAPSVAEAPQLTFGKGE